MWMILILLILLIALYLWSTYSCRQPTLTVQPPSQPVEDFTGDNEIPFEMQQPIFTEPDICTSRDPVFEVRSHSIS